MPSIEEEREKSWKDLDLTKEEAERFTNCFKVVYGLSTTFLPILCAGNAAAQKKL